MEKLSPEFEAFLSQGCGRCPKGGTPDCKARTWRDEMTALREIVLAHGLTETIKWGSPCYTLGDRNVLMIAAFKESCALSFFKGVLLADPTGLLQMPGENSQSVRFARFTSLTEIAAQRAALDACIRDAIAVEKAGKTVAFKRIDEFDVPEELQRKFEEIPGLQTAFEALTPGRRRGYLMHFAAAKQAKTRDARIEKYMPDIFAGKGMHDR